MLKDNKTLLLAHELNIPRLHAVGIRLQLHAIAEKHAPDGNISVIPRFELVRELGWTDGAIIGVLIDSGVLCVIDKKMIIHDWPNLCGNNVHRKLIRKILQFADGTVPKFNNCTKEEKEKFMSDGRTTTDPLEKLDKLSAFHDELQGMIKLTHQRTRSDF